MDSVVKVIKNMKTPNITKVILCNHFFSYVFWNTYIDMVTKTTTTAKNAK